VELRLYTYSIARHKGSRATAVTGGVGFGLSVIQRRCQCGSDVKSGVVARSDGRVIDVWHTGRKLSSTGFLARIFDRQFGRGDLFRMFFRTMAG